MSQLRYNNALPPALSRKSAAFADSSGLRGNQQSLHGFYPRVPQSAFKWLNRRGGKRRSFSWSQFNDPTKPSS